MLRSQKMACHPDTGTPSEVDMHSMPGHGHVEYHQSRYRFLQNEALLGGVRRLHECSLRSEGHLRLLEDRREYLYDSLFYLLGSYQQAFAQ